MSQAKATLTPGSREAAISAATASGSKDETMLRSSARDDHRSMATMCQYVSEIDI